MRNKFVFKVLTFIVTICVLSSIALSSFAATESDKAALQQKINETKQQQEQIKDDKNSATTELEEINAQVDKLQNDIDTLKAQIDEANSKIQDKQKDIENEEKEITEKNDLLKQRMVSLYEAGDTSYLDVLLNSDNLIDFMSGYSTIQTILEADTNLINELEDKKTQLEQDKKSLEDGKQDIENLKTEKEIKNANLVAAQKNKQSQIDKLSDAEKSAQDSLDKYNAAMARVNRKLEETYKKAQQQGLKFDGSFIWPCVNKTVTSGMKRRWGRLHKGIDIGANYENVYASASGYAYNAYDGDGYGNYIMIFHGSGYVTLYGHLSASYITNGQYVSQGKTIAKSGGAPGAAGSGSSQGAHLHFELRKADNVSEFFSRFPLNPLDYLPGGYTLAPGALTES